MSIETEVKVKVGEIDGFLRRLNDLKPTVVSERHFEDNCVFDYPDARLRLTGCLLRVRLAGDEARITFKGPPGASPVFKIREELETRVESARAAVEIFERLGMCVWFRYQKYRAEYLVGVGRAGKSEVHVALDETPIGVYAEFEGSEDGIREATRLTGFSESQFLRESYYALYVQFCQSRDREIGHMVFNEGRMPDIALT